MPPCTEPSNVGQPVTFTATVTPTATGNVNFFDGATLLGTVALDGSSQAAFTTNALTAGTHSITAAYGGDATHSGSTSPPLSQVVNAIAAGAAAIPTLDGRALAVLALLLAALAVRKLR